MISFSRHASMVVADVERMALPVRKGIEGKYLVFTRMVGVSISALRSSSLQPRDTVVVIGMGLMGNFAAQLFQMAGAEVMVADLSDLRLEKARACGIEQTVNPASENLEAAVMDWTDGEGARVVVEAIGVSGVINQAVALVGRHGEVILLGSPRVPATFDVTPMLVRIHLEPIRMVGALEWRWSLHETERVRDITANYRQVVGWIAEGQLVVEPLLIHLASPADCQAIYEGLTGKKEEYLRVVFDWGMG